MAIAYCKLDRDTSTKKIVNESNCGGLLFQNFLSRLSAKHISSLSSLIVSQLQTSKTSITYYLLSRQPSHR